ncbi:MAG: hypothetical protein HYT27_00405 [Parcubacteria group bacterium]|nr:hypothetical protein [Parcubacteria group bacterium]
MLFRGVGYKNIPKRPYEFVFIDGPSTTAPSDGHKTFNFDFIHVVSDSERPVFGILDLRLSTHYVLREIFGSEKVRFNPYRSLGFIGPCSKKDLHTTAEIINRHADDF